MNVYKITNLINNKIYIGVTKKDIAIRFKEHVAKSKTSSRNSLHNAILKYGEESFSISLIESCSKEKAFEKEMLLIKEFDLMKCGYNETPGGESGPSIIKWSKEFIENVLNDYINSSIKEAAKKNNISYYNVFDMTRGKFTTKIDDSLWSKVLLIKSKSFKRKRLTLDILNKICIDYINGFTIEQCSNKYSYSINNIWNIINRTTCINFQLSKDVEDKLLKAVLERSKMKDDINLNGAPNENYKKFFEKFKEIETTPVEQWKGNQLIGYFVKKYKDHYKIDFKFKFNSPAPSKCFEVFQMRKLSQHLSSDPKILKNYIDWVFKTKVPNAKRRLSSISFLTIEDTVNDYKLNHLLKTSSSFDRCASLPSEYSDLLSKAGLSSIQTYGDLAFLSKMNDMPENYVTAFNKLEELGLTKSMLEKIV